MAGYQKAVAIRCAPAITRHYITLYCYAITHTGLRRVLHSATRARTNVLRLMANISGHTVDLLAPLKGHRLVYHDTPSRYYLLSHTNENDGEPQMVSSYSRWSLRWRCCLVLPTIHVNGGRHITENTHYQHEEYHTINIILLYH